MCINLSVETTRKGLLKKIRKLLIREYKIQFNQKFYPMEFLQVGTRADLLNRRGIVALFNKDEDRAMQFWSEGLLTNDRHFDCKINLVMNRWSTAKINDQQMLKELNTYVLNIPFKGECLRAALSIATGDVNSGIT